MDNTAIPCGCAFTTLLNIRAYYSGKKMRNFGKIETDEEAWLPYDPDRSRKLKEGGGYK